MGQKIITDPYERDRKELDKAFLIVFVMKLLHPEAFQKSVLKELTQKNVKI